MFCVFSSGPRKKNVSLSIVSVQATNIPPKETVVYTKQTQTQNSGGHERDGEIFVFFQLNYLFVGTLEKSQLIS